MSVVLIVAAAVIGVGMIAAAVGRGGEMTEFGPDVRPIDSDLATAADVALLRPPVAPVLLGGYHRASTDEALNLVARTVTERDVEIAALRRQIADLQSALDAPPAGAPGAAGHLEASWEPHAFTEAEAGAAPDDASVAVPLGQPDPGSQASPLVRREAGPVPPPAQTQPWSAWEPPAPAPPDPGEPADPEQTG